jgi:hypothetical protein
VLFERTNVSIEADVEKLVAATVDRFGRPSLRRTSAPLRCSGVLHA